MAMRVTMRSCEGDGEGEDEDEVTSLQFIRLELNNASENLLLVILQTVHIYNTMT